MRPLKQTLNKTPLSNCTALPASAGPEAGLRSLPACFLLFFVLCRIITLTGKILYNFLVFFPFGILKPQTVASFLFPSPGVGGRAPCGAGRPRGAAFPFVKEHSLPPPQGRRPAATEQAQGRPFPAPALGSRFQGQALRRGGVAAEVPALRIP